MKKIFLTSALLFIVFISGIRAQELVTKSGTPILPQNGDWSIGFDVVPVFKAVGNLFHSSDATNFSQEEQTLVGLYVKNPTTYYRARLRIGYHSDVFENKVPDDNNTGTTTTSAQLTDSWTETKLNTTLGFGIQKIKGKGRLRGFYGGELFLKVSTHENTFTYANKFSQNNLTPSSSDFDSLFTQGSYAVVASSERPTAVKRGAGIGFGVKGFLGAEYFFAPKFSLSAEYGWGFVYDTIAEGTVSTEKQNAAGTGSDIITSKTGKTSSFSVDVQDAASIILHLYF